MHTNRKSARISRLSAFGPRFQGRKFRRLEPKRSPRRGCLAVTLILCCVLFAQPLSAADLEPGTVAAFNHYAQSTEQQFDADNADLNSFLWIDRLPQDRREAAYSEIRSGQVFIDHLQTLDGGQPIKVPGGIIHHWIGTIFVPGATLAQVLAFEQDYDHQQQYFAPDVVRSKLLAHSGPDYTVEIRFREKKIITIVLETAHQAHYNQLNSTQAWSRSWTTRIQQVDHPGEPSESLEPEGHDGGFLWRMDTYWRFEQKDGGTYIESQSVSLTRDIPTGLGWMIGPYVTSIPRESLTFMLAATRTAILQRIHSGTSN